MLGAKSAESAPPIAFMMTLRGYDAFPLDPHVRLQLFKSLTRGYTTGNINVAPAVADALYAISRRVAPHQASLLLSRIYYLAGSKRCGTECAELVQALVDIHGRQWFVKQQVSP